MRHVNRRTFLAAGTGVAARSLFAESGDSGVIDGALRWGVARRKIPAVVAMAASESKTLYTGAFGTRDSSGEPVTADCIFAIASMTKAVTTVAALQLVEQGKVDPEGPVSKYLPQLANLEVLVEFDANGKAVLAPAKTPVTLRHLLTHTAGFCYDTWDGDMFRYVSQKPAPDMTKPGPLMFEPGKRWQYGQGVDWAGRLVEAVSGMTLENYFQEKIFRPLGMTDTSYILPASKFGRLVSRYHRDASGELQQDERKMPPTPKAFNGGGGLYSTAADYVRFMQMILNRGKGPNDTQILKAAAVDSMSTNQIGALTAGKMKSYRPESSSDVDIQPGHTEKWGLGFLINTSAYSGGRSAGSLAWAGLYNTYYWIDPKKKRCAVILMQYLPFVDKEAIGMLSDFEKAVYSNL
uniref:Beta-lactamase n=1 Tax=Solibacter usitatus (strain Ellin6076) TaxID=234267 RepID=Q01WK0_SOLUE